MTALDSSPVSAVRRAVVKGLAALGVAGIVADPAAATPNVVVLHSATEDVVDYQFTVSGDLRKTASSGGAPVPDDAVTTDPEDSVVGNTAHGATAGGYDAYAYTGNITAFGVSNCESADVWVDGQAVDVCGLVDETPDDGGGASPPPGSIVLRGGYSSPVTFLIRVSGRIYSTRRHDRDSEYRQVEWQLGGSEPNRDRYRFSGHIEQLQTSDGEVDVVVRQRD